MKPSNSPKSYRKASQSAERVAYEIRQAILRRELLPSEHVRQEIWASRVGVSSGPTREALKMLVAEGLLTYDAHRGYFVARVDDREMAQLYRIRLALESEVLRTIRWPNDEEMAQFITLRDSVVTSLTNGDIHRALEFVRRFSFALFDLCPLDLLVRETKRFWDMAAMYRALSFRADEIQAHLTAGYYDRFIRCLEARDYGQLVEINSQHLLQVPEKVAQDVMREDRVDLEPKSRVIARDQP